MNLRILTVCLCLLAACKGEDDTTVNPQPYNSPGKLVIENNETLAINYKFYYSKADYTNSTNAFITVKLAPGERKEIDIATIEQRDSLYAGIYSDDFSITNWATRSVVVSFDETDYTNHIFELYYGENLRTMGNLRSYIINTNAAITTWHAVGISGQSQQDWDALPAYARVMDLMLHKAGEFELTRNNTTGASDNISGTYKYFYTTAPVSPSMDLGYTVNGNYAAMSLGIRNDSNIPYVSDTIRLYTTTFTYVLVKE